MTGSKSNSKNVSYDFQLIALHFVVRFSRLKLAFILLEKWRKGNTLNVQVDHKVEGRGKYAFHYEHKNGIRLWIPFQSSELARYKTTKFCWALIWETMDLKFDRLDACERQGEPSERNALGLKEFQWKCCPQAVCANGVLAWWVNRIETRASCWQCRVLCSIDQERLLQSHIVGKENLMINKWTTRNFSVQNYFSVRISRVELFSFIVSENVWGTLQLNLSQLILISKSQLWSKRQYWWQVGHWERKNAIKSPGRIEAKAELDRNVPNVV